MNQMRCFLNEGVTAAQYAADTLDPIAVCVCLLMGPTHARTHARTPLTRAAARRTCVPARTTTSS
jgi:hypothetical protein